MRVWSRMRGLETCVECDLHENLRNLSVCGVRMNANGSVDVSAVLECKANYECFCKYVVSMFKRRLGAVRGDVLRSTGRLLDLYLSPKSCDDPTDPNPIQVEGYKKLNRKQV